MKKTVTAKHCDDRPKDIELEDGDKAAFVCKKCHGLFEIDSEGAIIRSPLKSARVIENGVRYSMFKGRRINQ